MELLFKYRRLEQVISAANTLTAIMVVCSLALFFGFDPPRISVPMLHVVQIIALLVFVFEKFARMYNTRSKRFYLKAHWLDFSLLAVLLFVLWRAPHYESAPTIRQFAIGIYLFIQIVGKVARRSLNIAAHGKNPAMSMVTGFTILILLGTLFLLLPASTSTGYIGFVDAMFTATSAATVTGLGIKDTGTFFTPTGQHIILALMQLGGLGIIVFGAVFAFMVGQAMSVRETATMQNLLDMETPGHTGKMVSFVLITTMAIELLGTLAFHNYFKSHSDLGNYHIWFKSVFCSVSAFCNAGFALDSNSLSNMRYSWAVFLVFVPLIIAGSLGFNVLYNLSAIAFDRFVRTAKGLVYKDKNIFTRPRTRADLQTKIVLVTTALLIVVPTIAFLVFENNIAPRERIMSFSNTQEELFGKPEQQKFSVLDSLFQSVTTRTAGFSTVDISKMSEPSQALIMVLMFIGGSPGSTAGGIKTVTLAILFFAAWSSMRKRQDVEVFHRCVRLFVVGRAITIVLAFTLVLLIVTCALTITERHSGFTLGQLCFEATSALATCGLSLGVTPALTTSGKIIMIITMLIGRLGPMVFLASLTMNIKPVRYNFPEEPVVVG